MNRIFVDMDGILAEWNTKATMEEVFSEGYFEKLKPMRGTIDLCRMLINDGFDVSILSKAREDKKIEKLTWLDRYMPFIDRSKVIFVPLDANKKDYIDNPSSTDILIDDYNPNLQEWHGIAVKGLNGINSYNVDMDCIDLSFYKMYEDAGNIDEINDRLTSCMKQINYICGKETTKIYEIDEEEYEVEYA